MQSSISKLFLFGKIILNLLGCCFKIPERVYIGLAQMIRDKNLPSGNIYSAEDIGFCVRHQRKSQGATQVEFAALCGVGTRFISELENGKSTMELGKVLKVLKCLGLEISIHPRGWNQSKKG